MRSSPARRAATETNIAYRTADHERWQQLDFIVGIEVHLSNNHTCLGKDGKPHPFYDICDELKGKYPKDFKFTGWHPHCRCIATTILKTEAEMDADDEAILRGDEPADPDTSENAVTELPENFRGWMEANQDRIDRAKSLPYFIRDNEGVIAGGKAAVAENRMSMRGVQQIGYADITQRQQIEVANEIARLHKIGVFPKGTVVEFVDNMENGTLMGWSDEGALKISTLKFRMASGEELSIADELYSAIKKLKAGHTLGMKEEYAIESLFHENVHSKATKLFKIEKGSLDEVIKETCTQLYARDRYVKLMEHYGVDAVNFDFIQTRGYGYRRECDILRRFFTDDGGKLQVGELINIANETESCERILRKKLAARGLSERQISDFFMLLR